MASIALRHITKVFDRNIPAVSDLTLEVRDGEFMVVVGPSGCGKTTTLRLIAGLEAPTSGVIAIDGRSVKGIAAKDRDVAMVFQDGALYPHMSVYDNLAFALRMRKLGAAAIRQRVGQTAQMLGIGDVLRRKPASLSGGQRRRVALGRAIVREPVAFLLDEPLSNLDAALRLTMRSELKALHQRLCTTTLYVTHDQAEAMALGQRICVMRAGCVQQVGPPDEIYQRPANRFVAEFFGTPPMNVLPARVRCGSGGGLLEIGDACIDLSADRQASLSSYEDKTILVGVRPHDLSIVSPEAACGNVLLGRVGAIEPLGARTDVHVALASGPPCIVTVSPEVTVRCGQEVGIEVRPGRVHVFEHDDAGRRLSGAGGPRDE